MKGLTLYMKYIENKQRQKLEFDLIKARHEMNKAWIKLDKAITNYNLYLENKLNEVGFSKSKNK
jgi:hypothetical protein